VVVVLEAGDGLALRILADDVPLQAKLTTAAVAGEDLHAVQGGDDAARPAPLVKDLITLQAAVEGYQHLLRRF
jgi:hypothetical protein